MTFTSVAGHLMELDFTPEFKKWRSCNPHQLYNAPVQKFVPQVESLKRLIRSALPGLCLLQQWAVATLSMHLVDERL